MALLSFLQSERVMLVMSSFVAVAATRRYVLPRIAGPYLEQRFKGNASKQHRYAEVAFALAWYVAIAAIQAGELLPQFSRWHSLGYHDRKIGAGIPYYVLQISIGYYLSEVAHLFFEQQARRADHRQLAAHHFVTLFVLWLCQVYGYASGTLCALFLHDVCDIFLSVAKLANYEGARATSVLAFVGLLVCWVVGRLVLYPLVMYSMWAGRPGETAFVQAMYSLPGVLYLLDWYWFALILKVVANGLSKDVSDEDDEEALPPKKEN